jgi:DNA mismatch endonuclease, patch repair protein
MADVLTPEQRRHNMSRIRGRDTSLELRVRRGVYAKGLRFRLHDRQLPGRPDLVLKRYRTVVFVHGCFWHAHGCSLAKMPATRPDFWRKKIDGNRARDLRVEQSLKADGWRIVVFWECAVRGRGRREEPDLFDRVARFIRGGRSGRMEVQGWAGDETNMHR